MTEKQPEATQFPSHTAFITLSLLMIILCGSWTLFYLRNFYHDDAFIALRYAENIQNGYGVVWNPSERVEGFTSLLWVLLCSGLSFLGIDLIIASRLLGVASLLGLIIVLIRFEGLHGWFAALLVSANGSIVAWSVGGLETVGFTFLVTLGMLWLISLSANSSPARLIGVSTVFGVAELCRPEAVFFFAICCIYQTIQWSRNGKLSLRNLGGLVVPFTLIVASHLSWRLFYYGDWFPNTFYTKGSIAVEFLPDGLRYLFRFILCESPSLILLVYCLTMVHYWRQRFLLPLISVAAYAVYVVALGGDHMQWFRFMVPILPLLYVAAVRGLFASPLAVRSAWAPISLVGLILICNLLVTIWQGESGWKKRDAAARHGTLAGLYIREHWSPQSLVALNTGGSTAFFSKLRCIDMLGLNDKHIARQSADPDPSLPWTRVPGHRKGDGRYVLSRKPDYIIIGGSEGYTRPWFLSDKQIMEKPEFWENYILEKRFVYPRHGISGFLFRYFKRKKS